MVTQKHGLRLRTTATKLRRGFLTANCASCLARQPATTRVNGTSPRVCGTLVRNHDICYCGRVTGVAAAMESSR